VVEKKCHCEEKRKEKGEEKKVKKEKEVWEKGKMKFLHSFLSLPPSHFLSCFLCL